jgi:hypothetical protein
MERVDIVREKERERENVRAIITERSREIEGNVKKEPEREK